MLTPEQATPKALALLTMSHELYSAIDAEERPAHARLSEDETFAVLAEEDGTIDWQAIAIALGMIGHVLLEVIPENLFNETEASLAALAVKYMGADPATVTVNITNRVTGDKLLQAISLKVLEMESPPPLDI